MKLHFDGHGLNDETGRRIATFTESFKWMDGGGRNPGCDQLAALLAAAPDLYAACDEVLAIRDGVTPQDQLDHVCRLVRAALRKARGETKR